MPDLNDVHVFVSYSHGDCDGLILSSKSSRPPAVSMVGFED
jgi:hypothetical protein